MIRTASLALVALALTLVVVGCEEQKKQTEQAPGAKINTTAGTGKKSKAVEAEIPDPGRK